MIRSRLVAPLFVAALLFVHPLCIQFADAQPTITDVAFDPPVPTYPTSSSFVLATIAPPPERDLASVTMLWGIPNCCFPGGPSTVHGELLSGARYRFLLPPDTDDSQVLFWIRAVDDAGNATETHHMSYRRLLDGISSIWNLKGDPYGASFAGFTVPMQLDAVMQTDGMQTGIWVVQDEDATWNSDPLIMGIQIRSMKSTSPRPAQGDMVLVTEALVGVEEKGVYEQDPYEYV